MSQRVFFNSMYRNKRFAIFIAIFAILATYYILHTTHIFAQLSRQTVTITPPNVVLKVNPGDKKEGTMGLINDSNAPITFGSQVFDFVVTDTNGTPEVLPQGTVLNNKYSAASWVALYPPQFTLKPHERINLNYYIQIPSDARPGGHYAAIVFQPLTGGANQGSGAVIQSQIAALVYITVSGDVKQGAEVTKFTTPWFQEFGPATITTQIKNQGDLHINPQGTITLKNIFGKTVDIATLPNRNIFPGNVSLVYQTRLGRTWMFGRYTATLLAAYGVGNNLPLEASVAFWVIPWRVILLVILALAVAITAYFYWRRQNTPTIKEPEQEALNN
jgi:hypothetical protein